MILYSEFSHREFSEYIVFCKFAVKLIDLVGVFGSLFIVKISESPRIFVFYEQEN